MSGRQKDDEALNASDPSYPKTESNVIGGHKATISNPRTSEEAKAHSRQVLDELHGGGETAHSAPQEKDHGNVKRGLKATISNQSVSDEARERAKERLEKGDY
ncbi:Conidiation protein 6-domain-containing protein [Kalaharituber pfeilii]|nr:Conidiation protein 6-domain-containing protein [Kalaharituber pfeilii]